MLAEPAVLERMQRVRIILEPSPLGCNVHEDANHYRCSHRRCYTADLEPLSARYGEAIEPRRDFV